MPNTIAYANPANGEVRGVVGFERRGSTWYGTVWAEGSDTGTSGTFDSEADADTWVRKQLGLDLLDRRPVVDRGAVLKAIVDASNPEGREYVENWADVFADTVMDLLAGGGSETTE